MIQCPACGQRQELRLTCEGCGVPLGADLDCFGALGLPRKLVIDSGALERVYHDLSRRIHPDRFAQGSPRIRDASLRSTALLTRAYRTLRDPVARGLYWLELRGDKLAEGNKSVPPELAASGVAALRDRTTARRAELETSMSALQADLFRNFQRWDAGAADEQKLVAELKAVLSKIAYLRTLIRDVDRELENLKAA
jgi:DnaJ-domain-containing protein 1